MADNTTLPGTGEAIASDDIGGVKFQRVKLVLGADGVNDGDASSANPVPVSGPLTNTQLRAVAVSVIAALDSNGVELPVFMDSVRLSGQLEQLIEEVRELKELFKTAHNF